MTARLEKTIRGIAFDWGGVLIEDPAPGFWRQLAGRFHCSEEDLLPHLADSMDAFQRGRVSEEGFLTQIAERLNCPINTQPFWKDALRAVYREQPVVIDLARSLKDKGYAVGLLSNTEVPAREFNFECDYDFFDARVFSCDEGFAKPEKEVYNLMSQRLGVSISELLMIDDKEENIAGARVAGASGILFESPARLLEQLESHGVYL